MYMGSTILLACGLHPGSTAHGLPPCRVGYASFKRNE